MKPTRHPDDDPPMVHVVVSFDLNASSEDRLYTNLERLEKFLLMTIGAVGVELDYQ